MPRILRTMSRTLRAFTFVVLTTACGGNAPAKPSADAPTKPSADASATPSVDAPAKPSAPPSPEKADPSKAEPSKSDPILLKICKAFDEVSAEGKADQANMLMASAAVRATELGVTEAQLEALGPQPPQLLESIRKRGNPPECAAFVAYLEALP